MQSSRVNALDLALVQCTAYAANLRKLYVKSSKDFGKMLPVFISSLPSIKFCVITQDLHI